MFKKRKYFYVLICIVTLIGVLSTIYFIQKSLPQNMLERKLKIKLPSGSQIIKYSYYNHGEYFDSKISVEAHNINNVIEQLNVFFREPYEGELSNIPNFENTCQWWDLNKNNIETCYFTFVSSEKSLFGFSPKSHEVWAFVTKEKDGQCYLYISY